jgi:hypothetical protein
VSALIDHSEGYGPLRPDAIDIRRSRDRSDSSGSLKSHIVRAVRAEQTCIRLDTPLRNGRALRKLTSRSLDALVPSSARSASGFSRCQSTTVSLGWKGINAEDRLGESTLAHLWPANDKLSTIGSML